MNKENKIYLFDTTLRDGQQTTGVNFSVSDKMTIAKNLDELWSTLENEDYDDEIVINFNAKSDCLATERDEIKIVDENNKIIWEDK